MLFEQTQYGYRVKMSLSGTVNRVWINTGVYNLQDALDFAFELFTSGVAVTA